MGFLISSCVAVWPLQLDKEIEFESDLCLTDHTCSCGCDIVANITRIAERDRFLLETICTCQRPPTI
jgi:hypothetical protein